MKENHVNMWRNKIPQAVNGNGFIFIFLVYLFLCTQYITKYKVKRRKIVEEYLSLQTKRILVKKQFNKKRNLSLIVSHKY